MCGIAGYVGEGTPDDLNAMIAAVTHRGPDDAGTWFSAADKPVALGFRRLTILDPHTGAQPMVAENGDLAVVFNGEIYNHRDLREELTQEGARFRTDHSDTEVLLHAYAAWGPDMLSKLNGMFAFSLVDRARKRVLLARDPFGKKPLYYAVHRNGLAFCSELRGLMAHPAVDGGIDPVAMAQYFAFGFVPAPASLVRGARKLRGGDYAIYDIGSGTIECHRYWRYRVQVAPPGGTEEDWSEELARLLRKATARRLEADVPLGLFLSGGIDSAAVAAFAQQARGARPLNAFTLGFQERSFDETELAAATAARTGIRHHVRQLDSATALATLPEVLRRMDEPVADPSLVPTYLVSRFAREQVTVALSGDGADELFAGYDTFPVLEMARRYAALPAFVRRMFSAMVSHLPPSRANLSVEHKLKRALRGLQFEPAMWLPAWIGPADPRQVLRICQSNVELAQVYGDVFALWNGCASSHMGDRQLEFYAEYYLQGGILAKVDRASMMNSLEVRSPFLDREVAEFSLRLPFDAKLRGGRRKWLLRQALAPHLPPAVLEGKKRGFAMPVQQWLRHIPPPSRERADAAGLDGTWLAAQWRKHGAGEADYRLLFAWLALDTWLEGTIRS